MLARFHGPEYLDSPCPDPLAPAVRVRPVAVLADQVIAVLPLPIIESPLPSYPEFYDATYCLDNPRRVLQDLMPDFRTLHREILEAIFDPDLEEGNLTIQLAVRQFYMLPKLTLMSRRGAKHNLRRFRSKDFKTLLNSAKVANESARQGSHTRGPAPMSTKKVTRLLREKKAGKVIANLTEARFASADDISPEKLDSLFPSGLDYELPDLPEEGTGDIKPFEVAKFMKFLRARESDKAPGYSGYKADWDKEMFTIAYLASPQGLSHARLYTKLHWIIANGDLGKLDPDAPRWWFAGRAVFIEKPGPVIDWRPIQMVETWVKAAYKFDSLPDPDRDVSFDWQSLPVGPQFGVNCPSGGEAVVWSMRMCARLAQSDRQFVICSVDSETAFQKVSVGAVLSGYLELGMPREAHKAKARLCLGGQVILPWGSIRELEKNVGLPQGHPLSPRDYAAAAYFNQLQRKVLCEDDTPAVNVNLMDDNYCLGNLASILKYLHAGVLRQKSDGICLKTSKSGLFTSEDLVESLKKSVFEIVEALNLDPSLKDLAVRPLHELEVLRVPVTDHAREFAKISVKTEQEQLLRTRLLSLKYPKAQLYLLKKCFAAALKNWTSRTGGLPVGDLDHIREALTDHDTLVLESFCQYMHIDLEDMQELQMILVSISKRLGGVGLRRSADHLQIARTAAIYAVLPVVRSTLSASGLLSQDTVADMMLAEKSFLEDSITQLRNENVWVNDNPEARGLQRVLSTKRDSNLAAQASRLAGHLVFAEDAAVNQNIVEDVRYRLRARASSSSYISTCGFLDFFGDSLSPNDLRLDDPDTIASYPLSIRSHLCCGYRPLRCSCGKPLGALLQHASCKPHGPHQIRRAADLGSFLEHLCRKSNIEISREVKVAGANSNKRPGDLCVHLPFKGKLLIDHSFTNPGAPSRTISPNCVLGHFAEERVKQKFAKYAELLLDPAPVFVNPDGSPKIQDLNELFEKAPRLVGEPFQKFLPIASEVNGPLSQSFEMILLCFASWLYQAGRGTSVKALVASMKRNISCLETTMTALAQDDCLRHAVPDAAPIPTIQ